MGKLEVWCKDLGIKDQFLKEAMNMTRVKRLGHVLRKSTEPLFSETNQ